MIYDCILLALSGGWPGPDRSAGHNLGVPWRPPSQIFYLFSAYTNQMWGGSLSENAAVWKWCGVRCGVLKNVGRVQLTGLIQV